MTATLRRRRGAMSRLRDAQIRFRRRTLPVGKSFRHDPNRVWRFLMKRALLSIGTALVLAAALPTLADAQSAQGGGRGGGGGGGAARAAPSGGGGGAAIGGGGGFARSATGGGFAAAQSGGPRVSATGSAFAAVPGGGQRIVQGGGNWQGGNWQGRNWSGRRHFRGGGFAVYGAAPYYDDDATPYAYYGDDDSGCYQLRLYRGEYRRVWVCN
jgi:hypothetical protein